MWPWNGPGANLTEAGRRPASAWPGRVPRATLVNFSLGKGRCQEHRLGSADCKNGGPEDLILTIELAKGRRFASLGSGAHEPAAGSGSSAQHAHRSPTRQGAGRGGSLPGPPSASPRPISSGSEGPPGQDRGELAAPTPHGCQHRCRAHLHTQFWVNVGVARARILQNRPPVGVRLFEHTADLGIEVWAPSLESCFARAAAGMFASFVALGPRSGAEQSVRVEVSADGVEELMVSWLEELLFESEVKGIALHSFEVQSVVASHAVGLALGPAFGPASTQVGPVIKAVTRHGLEVRRAGRHWRARIIFDV